MKKLLSILLALMLLFALCACTGQNDPAQDKIPDNTVSDQNDKTDHKAEEDDAPENPNDEDDVLPPSVSNWEEIYTGFLSENYTRLVDACGIGFAGIGFIDLDLDGMPEMLLFDNGTSSSMGVQFFDIVDGAVTCVSANIEAIGQAFGGEYLCNEVVNTKYFKNFRLMLNNDTGKQYFCIESANGAMNFQFKEMIRFSGEKGILSLESLFHSYIVYGGESTNIISEEYSVDGQTADADTYQAAADAFNTVNTDTQYSASGVFTWDGAYPNTRDGLLSMAAAAANLFKPIV